jgi:hypothetical protein
VSATRHRPPATTSAKAAASQMWGKAKGECRCDAMRCDAMLVCQELHPLPIDEAMIGQAGSHTTALRCMVPYQPILVHQSCESIFSFFFFLFEIFFSVLLLLVHVHGTFEILLCAYYSDREREKEKERVGYLVRASEVYSDWE